MKPFLPIPKMQLKLALLLVLNCSIAYSQTPGPAGVGNSDGSNGQPKSVLWLDASAQENFTFTQNRINLWKDLSGNGNNATANRSQDGGGVNNGTYPTTINDFAGSHSAVRLTANKRGRNERGGYFTFDGNCVVNTEYSIFSVAQKTNGTENAYILGGNSTANNSSLHWGMKTNNIFYYSEYGSCNGKVNNLEVDHSFTNDIPYLFSTVRKLNPSSPWNKAIFINGAKLKDEPFNCDKMLVSYNNATIGRHLRNNNDVSYASIDIAELILYASALNEAQRLIVDNYLGAKYARDLGANRLYNAPNNGYLNNIIGVGASYGEKHIETSGNGGGLYLKENSNVPFNETEFVMAGSNNAETGYTPEDCPTEIANVKPGDGNVLSRSNRIWYIDRTEETNTSVKMGFDVKETGANFTLANQIFVLLYREGTSGNFVTVPGMMSNVSDGKIWFTVDNDNLKDGYYTVAATDLTCRIWYSLTSGNWDDPTTWTLDPSGAQPQNPEGFTPYTSPTGIVDQVVVLSGRNVTVSSNSRINSKLTVNGAVDFGTTTGQHFVRIEGTGRILLAGDNFPEGDATHFVTKGQGEGTVEYYGSTRELTASRTFYNVIVDMTAGNTLTQLADYNINGDFTVKNGTFKINSDDATTPLNLTVNGNVQIESNGQIATGTANARHQMNLYGNFTNRGTAKFTNRTAADYTNEATDGIVDVNFLNEAANQSVLCRGITNFYRIEIDKGVDQTYILNIDASSPTYFNLLGYASEAHIATTAQLTENNNALGLVHGTVRLGNSLIIPTLTVAGNYTISANAGITVDGAAVTQNNNNSTLSVFGTLRSSTGTINVGNTNNDAIVLCNNGSLIVEGGTVNANQIRVANGAGNNGGYIQMGGTVNVLGNSIGAIDFSFNLPNSSSVYNMLGGTLSVSNASGTGGINIQSSSENIQVTGGNVIADIASSYNLRINSTAPFWNLSLKNTSGSNNNFVLETNPLRILKDLKLWGQQSGGASYPIVELITGTNDVYIGGSMNVETGAKYTAISDGTSPYDTEATQPTSKNTTHFNKTAATSGIEYIFNGDTANPLEFGNLVVDRTSGHELQMKQTSGRTDGSVVLDINGSATVASGTLDQGRYSIRTWGNITNNGRMGKYIAGTTPDNAQIIIGEKQNLTVTSGKSSVFGNVKINADPAHNLTIVGDTYIECLEYTRGLVYLQNYELRLDRLWGLNSGLFEDASTNSKLKVDDTGYSGESMIYTNGNAGDGGLKIKVTRNSDASENEASRLNNTSPITYPLGFLNSSKLYFRPAQMVVKNFSDDGYVTIRTVSGYLQTTNKDGGKVLQHYWRVTHEGFDAKPTVAYRFYYKNINNGGNNNVVDLYMTSANEEKNFLGGKVLDESPYTRSYEDASDIDRTNNDTRTIAINGTSSNAAFNAGVDGIEIENANYTAGEQSRFTGSVRIYYTRDKGAQERRWDNDNEQWIYESISSSYLNKEPYWDENVTWASSDNLDPQYSPHDSRQPAADSHPGEGDVAVIGWVPWNDIQKDGDTNNGGGDFDVTNILGMPHGVWVTDEQKVAEIVFSQMLDQNGNPTKRVYRSNFQFRPTLCINGRNDRGGNRFQGSLTAKIIKGEGLIWNRQTDPDFTKMDIGDFARQDSSYVIYENFSNDRVINNSADLFPNLYISNDGWGANNHNFTFARDLETTGNLELLGNVNLNLSNEYNGGDITVGRDLIMFTSGSSGGGAELRYRSSGPVRKVIVKGDLRLENEGAQVSVSTTANSNLIHELHVEGSIYQGTSSLASDGLQLFNRNNTAKVTLFLEGNKSMEFNRVNENGDNSTLYRVVVDKGSSPATTATFNTNFTLNGPTSGAGVAKALELKNGTFIYNPTSNNNNVDLSTGNDYFSIPSTAGLTIKKGRMTVSGNSGIALDGKLMLEGGTLDMGNDVNDIEYSASGKSDITIMPNATLTVGGQIRRSTTSDEGVLKYSQTGGNVSVGINGARVNSRGVFEILNAGSSFTMTNGTFTIARAQNNPSISAFYFDPETNSISGNSKIVIGNNNTPTNTLFGVYANKSLPNLEIAEGTAKLDVVPATITKLLDIKNGATFDANSLDLTLKGDFSVSGTFIPNGNTTYFSGSSTQIITGVNATTPINFYNFDKTGNNILTLADNKSPLTIANEMNVRGGTLTAYGNNITVLGNMLNDGIMTCADGTTYGVLLQGSQQQTLKGNGSFSKLSLQNDNGVGIPVGNHITINSSLNMLGCVFNIGMNFLDLSKDATIEAGADTPFSSTNMITTNISFNDNGVRKTFDTGSTNNFIFPVGSGSKYTPVTFDITGNGNNTGKITVVPSNEVHASVKDKDNALQYYWTLKSEGIEGFMGTAKMKYIESDVKVTAPYTVADYITAQLLNNGSGEWLKFDNTNFDETNHDLIFNFSDKNDETISGDYTAGINPAIPDKVASYESLKTDFWKITDTWNPNVSGGPSGAITKINEVHTVTMNDNNYHEYSTEILGKLQVNETVGHRLGIVTGTGTLYMENGTIPAAVYDKFFAAEGGTVEFSGTKSYEFLGNVLAVNNLKISGSGTKTMPNNDFTLNGNLIIDGDASLKIVNSYNKKLSVNGNITRTQGLFDAGTGSTATVAVVGNTEQNIVGAFTGDNAFNNLLIDKEADKVKISDNVEIDRNLSLNKGIVDVKPGSTFKINYGATITGGSINSFVTGELTAEMMNGQSFTFPVGDVSKQSSYGEMSLKSVSGPSGICDWKVRYYFEEPPCDLEQFELPISTISTKEYWTITAPTGGHARIAIALNGTNDVATGISDLKYLRVVGYNTTTNKWEVIGGGASVTGTSSSGMVTTTSKVNLGAYSCITLGAITPLDKGSVWFNTTSTMSLCTQGTVALDVKFSGVAPYEFIYTTNGLNPQTITTSNSTYTLIVTPPIGTTVYKLTGMKSTDNIVSGGLVPGVVSGQDEVKVTINSAVTPIISTSDTEICEDKQVTFTATSGYSNYKFRVNNVVMQNSSSNTYVTSTLPSGTPSIDVIASSSAGCTGTSSAISVEVNPKPAAAGTIAGAASVCLNSESTFSIPTIANATSYYWSISNGAQITQGQNSQSVKIRFNTAGSTTITVVGRNSCGDGVAATKVVSVSADAATGAAGNISGIFDICKGGTYTYTVDKIPNATSYVWEYSNPTGVVINGTDNEVSITFSNNAANGTLTVKGTNGCKDGTSSSQSLTLNTPPTVTLPDASGCEGGEIALNGSATGGSGSYTYSWSGDEVTSLSNQAINTPTFSKEGGITTSAIYNLTLSATDNKGCVGSKTASVTVYERPRVNAGIDVTDLCSGKDPVYMTGATVTGNYAAGTATWTVDQAGIGTITKSDLSPANASFTPNSIYGVAVLTLTVTGSNGCADVSDSRHIKWSGVPMQPSEISGATKVCKGSSGITYSVTKDNFVDNYIWSYSGTGATITQTDNSIVIDFADVATSGKLSVYGSSACGNSSVRELEITLSNAPSSPIIKETTVCAGDVPELLLVNPEAGCTYKWNVGTVGYAIVTSGSSTSLTTPNNDALFPVNTTNLVDYPLVTVVATNSTGCSSSYTSDNENKKIKVVRIPRTGAPYHLKNDVAK